MEVVDLEKEVAVLKQELVRVLGTSKIILGSLKTLLEGFEIMKKRVLKLEEKRDESKEEQPLPDSSGFFH